MAIRNTTHDLSSEELAAVKAADLAGHAAALAGNTTITSEETAAVGYIVRALRGRGHAHIFGDLLNMYYEAAPARGWFNGTAATACGATNDKPNGTL